MTGLIICSFLSNVLKFLPILSFLRNQGGDFVWQNLQEISRSALPKDFCNKLHTLRENLETLTIHNFRRYILLRFRYVIIFEFWNRTVFKSTSNETKVIETKFLKVHDTDLNLNLNLPCFLRWNKSQILFCVFTFWKKKYLQGTISMNKVWIGFFEEFSAFNFRLDSADSSLVVFVFYFAFYHLGLKTRLSKQIFLSFLPEHTT